MPLSPTDRRVLHAYLDTTLAPSTWRRKLRAADDHTFQLLVTHGVVAIEERLDDLTPALVGGSSARSDEVRERLRWQRLLLQHEWRRRRDQADAIPTR